MSAGRIRQIVVALALIACARTSSATPIVSISPAGANVSVGSSVSFDVTISNVTDLFAFQFDLVFNPLVLNASSVLEGGFLGTGGSTVFAAGTIDNVLGTVSSVTDSLVGPVSGVSSVGPAVLASTKFVATAFGVSSIDIFNILLLDSNLDIINFQAVNGTVTATPVPEPATLTLVAIGLVGAARLRRRRHRSVT